MNAKHGYAGAVLLVVLAGPLVQAQVPTTLPPLNNPASVMLPPDPPVTTLPLPGNPAAAPTGSAPAPILPSDAPSVPNVQAFAPDAWVYQQKQASLTQGCCGPIGGNGPMGTDVDVNLGTNLVLSHTQFGRAFHAGYNAGLGGRTLFFNQECTQAWNINAGLNYIYNDGHGRHQFFNSAGQAVTLRNLDRTTVGLGMGYDWWLLGSGYVGNATGCNLRFGVDGGFRVGTSHLDMNVVNLPPDGYSRVQRIFGEYFTALHLNLEVPMGGWTFLTGVRSEFAYSDLHLLPGHQTNGLYGLNLLLTMGVRY